MALNVPPLTTAAQGENVHHLFAPPPFDAKNPINDVIDWHMDHSANYTYSAMTSSDNEALTATVTYAELGEKVHHLGRQILDLVPEGPMDDATGRPRTMAIIADIDTLTYDTYILAIMRCGFVPFPITSQNTIPAFLNLLIKANCYHLLSSPPSEEDSALPIQRTIHTLLQTLHAEYNHSVKIIPLVRSKELYPRLFARPIAPYEPTFVQRLPPIRTSPHFQKYFTPAGTVVDEWPGVMTHSSGSTSLPKPIILSQKSLYSWGTLLHYGEVDLSGSIWAGFLLPAYHAIGVCAHILLPFCSGSIAAQWLPSENPVPRLDANALGQAVTQTKCKIVFSTPFWIEQWAQSPAGLEMLKSLDYLSCGGALLKKEIGDQLVEEGVKLQIFYAMSETGPLFRHFLKESLGKDWEYGSWPAAISPRLVPFAENSYRLEIKANENNVPAIFNVPGERVYNTNDLVQEHPTRKGFYKVLGRVDDQLIMSNGEIVNALAIETVIKRQTLVKNVMVIASGLPKCGLLVEPTSASFANDKEAFIDEIWPAMEACNAEIPVAARVQKSLIVVGVAGKPIPITVKGNVKRHDALKLYQQEIDEVFMKFGESPRI